MRLWLVCFITLFGAAELAQWLGQFRILGQGWGQTEFPLPILVIGGISLAIASNYHRLPGLMELPLPGLGRQAKRLRHSPTSPPPPPQNPVERAKEKVRSQLPAVSAKPTKSAQPISFKVPPRRPPQG
jgi:hypothetical protein